MLREPTKALLQYLNKHPTVRAQIRAAPGKTWLYAGNFMRPMWQEVADLKRKHPKLASKETLPDVLARIPLTKAPYPTLLAWAQAIDKLPAAEWRQNGFVAWRALSGMFAANAMGAVSFSIGSGVSHDDKVFAATEIHVLARNAKIDPLTRDLVAFYQRCLQTKEVNVGFGFISA